jgi:pimeloyl-ACP methyl ester carboxylesterase
MWLVLVAAVLAAGAFYQAISVRREAARFPAPGQLVEVGHGRRLHLVCAGAGEPTVVFESPGFGSSMSFNRVRAELNGRVRTCSYDRMGFGWSDPGPSVISAGILADDLHTLLQRASIKPPYVLVPASIGGLTVELFARRHPDEVAGLVFLDAADSGALEIVNAIRGAAALQQILRDAACTLPLAARFGLVRLIDPFATRRQSSDEAARQAALMYRPAPMQTLCAIQRGRPATLAEFRAAPPLPADVPLVVLSHDKPTNILPPILPIDISAIEPLWRVTQQRLSQRSSRSRWQTVPGSGHLIASSQPHAVAEEILGLLARIGSGR